MKKIFFTLAIVGFALSGSFGKSKEKMIDGGPYLHTGLFMPSANYGGGAALSMGVTLKFGVVFNFAEAGNLGIGLNSTFLEGNYAQSVSVFSTGYVFQGSVVRVGPNLSYKLSESMAMDLYLQGGPTVMVAGSAGNPNATSALSLTSNVGFAYRWKTLSLGFEFGFGRVRDNDTRGSGPLAPFGAIYYPVPHMKILIGAQF